MTAKKPQVIETDWKDSYFRAMRAWGRTLDDAIKWAKIHLVNVLMIYILGIFLGMALQRAFQ